MNRRAVLATLLVGTFATACQGRRGPGSPDAEDPAACAAAQHELIGFLAGLPARALVAGLDTELPESTLGMPPGPGPLLEVSATRLRYEGMPTSPSELGAEFARTSVQTLLVAAPAELTVGELRAALAGVPETTALMLLVRTRTPQKSSGNAAAGSTPAVSERLLLERNHRARVALSREGYRQVSACGALDQAVASVEGAGTRERWPSLKRALLDALSRCACDELDAGGLRSLLLAEQRAGSGALGALPLDFVRDRRCNATMPLRSLGRLLEQVEEFDAENAGRWEDDALRFEQVVNSQRLREEFCDALPGETLIALAKSRATLWARLPGDAGCSGFTLEPLSRGAPMGTLKPAGQTGQPFHFWLGAEELDIFGPAEQAPPSRPTDRRSWACRASHRLTGIDGAGIELEQGRFFFSRESCRAAPAERTFPGCLGRSAEPEPAAEPTP